MQTVKATYRPKRQQITVTFQPTKVVLKKLRKIRYGRRSKAINGALEKLILQ